MKVLIVGSRRQRTCDCMECFKKPEVDKIIVHLEMQELQSLQNV